MRLISLRISIGMLGPLIFQVLLTMLYSSIRYEEINSRLLLLFLLTIFPLVIMHVISPFLLSYYGRLEDRLEKLFSKGLDQVLLRDDSFIDTRTKLRESVLLAQEDRKKTAEEIKKVLVPILVKPALDGYKDTFYARDKEVKANDTLDYYESLALFSIYTVVFFTVNLVITWFLKFTSVNLIVIQLDQIEEWNFVYLLTIFFVAGIVLSYLLFGYSIEKMESYLPYAVPNLFYEDPQQNMLRKEQIRSVLSYNLDSLLPRNIQRVRKYVIDESINQVAMPLLKEEFLIKSRKNLALKLAFEEYSLILARRMKLREKRGQITEIDRLLLGEKIAGAIQFNNDDLLGLNMDLMYVRSQIADWKELSKEQREMTYIQLYRLIERVIKQICFNLSGEELEVDTPAEVNFFEGLKWLSTNGYMDRDTYSTLNHFRFLRNQVIHEPGTEIQVSSTTLIDVIRDTNQILKNAERKFIEGQKV